MKTVMAGLVLLVGMAGVGYCQSRASDQSDRPVHPGTALLDSMGIVAGAPDGTPTRNALTDRDATVTLGEPANPSLKRQ
ncbi:MAG TPA: hypothetical protein VGI78_17070 [Acetobacteraceae bacterium]|jgi:hypothetical protein